MGMAARSTGLVQQRIALMRYAIKAIFDIFEVRPWLVVVAAHVLVMCGESVCIQS